MLGRWKEISPNFLRAGCFYQGSPETKIAVFPVYKYMWENPLKLPPTFRIFLFGLLSRTKAVTQGSLARRPGCSLHPAHRQKRLDGIACHHLLSQLSTHKPEELASRKTKDQTQNVKRATVLTCLGMAIFSLPPCMEKYCSVPPEGLRMPQIGHALIFFHWTSKSETEMGHILQN